MRVFSFVTIALMVYIVRDNLELKMSKLWEDLFPFLSFKSEVPGGIRQEFNKMETSQRMYLIIIDKVCIKYE